jgi:AcrR family transcriptional regulator
MTMRLLGDVVGLDNSSLYRHFASKAHLVHAAIDRVAQEVLSTVRPLLNPSVLITLKALEDICATVGTHFFDHPASARLMVHWIMSMGEEGPGYGVSVAATDRERPGGELLGILSRWLEQGVQRGVLRRHAMPEAVIVMLGAIVIRPATYGHLLKSLEPKRSRLAARKAWEAELRLVIRGAFAP